MVKLICTDPATLANGGLNGVREGGEIRPHEDDGTDVSASPVEGVGELIDQALDPRKRKKSKEGGCPDDLGRSGAT